MAQDPNNDITLLKITDELTLKRPIPYTFGNRLSDVGSGIFVLGYPLRASMGDEIKLTSGIVSSKTGFQGDVTAYQISAAVQPGNSGGPVIDGTGNIIGIINAKHSGAENASYAIKASYLLNLLELSNIQLPPVNRVGNKPLTEQVKSIKDFVYIVEVQ